MTGPSLRVGDVADIQGEHAEELAQIEVAPAPLPGRTKQVQAALVQSRIAEAGFTPHDVTIEGATLITATTLHLEVTPDLIEQDLRRFIESSMPWDPKDATIDLMTPTFTSVVPVGEVTVDWKPNPQYNYLGVGAFRGEILVDGEPQKTVVCKASIEAYGDAVIAVNEIPRGTIIQQSDVVSEKRALSTLRHGAFDIPEDIVGQVARSTIFPGGVINKRQVMPRVVVKRNQMVTVQIQAGALLVTARAKALADAGIGDVVPCMNLDSEEQFYGRVLPDGTIAIE